MSLQAVVSEIQRRESFCVTTHISPEGDAVGSALALGVALCSMGKKAQVVFRDPIPRQLRFLPHQGMVSVRKRLPSTVDALLVVDCGDLGRTGFFKKKRPLTGRIINVDHHRTNNKFGDVNWVDPAASATGEMIYLLLRELGVAIGPAMATALYTTLITETGSFHYLNTSARVLQICAELIGYGADPFEIARRLYEQQTEGRLRLMGLVFSELASDRSRKIAWVTVTLSMLDQTGTVPEDSENLVNYLGYLQGILVAILFRQIDRGSFKVSFRSHRVDVSRIAVRLGGGGHAYAAGCTIQGTRLPVQRRVLRVVREELRRIAK